MSQSTRMRPDGQSPNREPELFMLAGIATILRWVEELLNILNGPILMFGAGIALVDLLTDGALTLSLPVLLFAWAVSQALGIDTQLLGCFARARQALRLGTRWAMAGWLVLGTILGYAAWQAGYVFAVQQSQHISEAAALSQLGMDPAVWLGWRAFLGVGLVALSGWTRYHPPVKVAPSHEDERTRLERELELAPLRQQIREQQARGARGVVEALRGKSPVVLPVDRTELPVTGAAPHNPERPPTGPGTPVSSPLEQEAPELTTTPLVRVRSEPEQDAGDDELQPAAKRTRNAERKRVAEQALEEVRMRRTIELLRQHPDLTPRQLTRELPNLSWQKAKQLIHYAKQREAARQQSAVR